MSTEPGGRPPPEPVDVTAPAPAPPRTRSAGPRSHVVSIALTATALLVASSITATVVAGHDDDPLGAGGVAIGDCIRPLQEGEGLVGPAGEITQSPAKSIDCKAPEAAYRIAMQGRGADLLCPDPAYRVRRAGIGTPDARTLCMTYNVDTDECFVMAPAPAVGPYDCGLGPRPNAIRMLRVVHGLADPHSCMDLDEDLLVTTVPEPATTFCYVRYASESGTDDGVVRTA